MKKLLIFTDLDGSLLDHHDYSWEQAIPALNALKKHSCPLIINSSKTAAEIIKLNRQLENNHPFISENGAVIYTPTKYFSSDRATITSTTGFTTHFFAKSYKELIISLNKLHHEYQFKFSNFNNMRDDELAKLCNLSEEQAHDAKNRDASEPLLWQDTEVAFEKFKSLLKKQNLITVKGGRFIHVMSDVDKGKSLCWLTQRYEQQEPEYQWVTVGLGDSFNDVSMLEVVDHPVLIPNPATKQPDLSYLSNLISPNAPGPEGWNDAILSLLDKTL